MFEFFKRRSTPKITPESIARDATIQPVLIAGDIAGFLVHLNVDRATATATLNSQASQTSFVTIIESRIEASDYEDDRFAPTRITPPQRKVLESAKRAVLIERKPFVSW